MYRCTLHARRRRAGQRRGSLTFVLATLQEVARLTQLVELLYSEKRVIDAVHLETGMAGM